MASTDLRSQLNCSICLDIFKDPVTLRCGHTFCELCIRTVLDSQERSQVFTCPECRKRFKVRPGLQRNITLCNLTQYFHPPESEKNVPVFCSYCIHGQPPAVATCVPYTASLCDAHLNSQSTTKEHVCSESSTASENIKCPIHKKVLHHFSTLDGASVCVCCKLEGEEDGCRGRLVERLSEAFLRKEQLKSLQEKLCSKKDKTDSRVHSLQEQQRKVVGKAAAITESVSTLFRDIREKFDGLENRIRDEIARQEQEIVHSASDLLQKLQMKKDKLLAKILHIEEMCKITDPLTILQGWKLDCAQFCDAQKDMETEDKKDFTVGDLDEGIISAMFHSSLNIIVSGIKNGFYVQEASNILLNTSTAGSGTVISGDLKMICVGDIHPAPQKTPEQFDFFQAFSTNSFSSGQHYWEVEASGSGCWKVGVAYSSVDRKEETMFGDDNKSWVLSLYEYESSEKEYSVAHDKKNIVLPVSSGL